MDKRDQYTNQAYTVVVMGSSQEETDNAENDHLGASSYHENSSGNIIFPDSVSELGINWLLVNGPSRNS